jgi:GNAT superfamily N-acetyltransferase
MEDEAPTDCAARKPWERMPRWDLGTVAERDHRQLGEPAAGEEQRAPLQAAHLARLVGDPSGAGGEGGAVAGGAFLRRQPPPREARSPKRGEGPPIRTARGRRSITSGTRSHGRRRMPEPVTIREAVAQDVPELARLRWEFQEDEARRGEQTFSEFVAEFHRFWDAFVEAGRWTIWVAESGERLVANMWVQHIPKVPHPGLPFEEYGYLTNVYVEAEHRRNGLGSALLRRVIEGAREHQLEFLIVWPSEESVPFYQRLGFSPSDEALELHWDR